MGIPIFDSTQSKLSVSGRLAIIAIAMGANATFEADRYVVDTLAEQFPEYAGRASVAVLRG